MSEDAKLQESIKKTQDLLGKYIKKPPLTEKLLRKPPFRFLHDIVTSVIKETGFLKGLFNEEESNSANIKDKDAKLSYLTKLLDVIQLIIGHELAVRASKIIAGQEPIKTNEMLQAIGRALDKKISSSEAIEHYKKTSEKKKGVTKLKKSSSPQEKLGSKISAEDKKTRRSNHSEDKVKKSSSRKSTSSEQLLLKEKVKVKDEKSRKKNKEENVDKKDEKSRESRRNDSSEISKKPKEQELVIPEERIIDSQEILTENVDNNEDTIETSAVETLKSNIEPVENENIIDENKSIMKENSLDAMKEEKTLLTPPKTMESSQKSIVLGREKSETEIILEARRIPSAKPAIVRPGTARPPTARPSSARPGAPRIRGKTDFLLNVNDQMEEASAIMNNFDTKEDDTDEMVVMETLNNKENLQGNSDLLNNQLTQENGYLVAQILETQRELANEGNVDIIPNKVEIEWEAGSKKDRDTFTKEIDKLRGTIQTLIRSTNPLGKLLDFLPEDVEIMEKELWDWRNQYNTTKEKLQIEKNAMKESLKPLEESLKEVERSIAAEQEINFQLKGNILKNDQKINRLLNGS